jgi:hypothetical protein
MKKDSFYEELERVVNTFLKYHIKMFIGDFNSKVGNAIFKPTNSNKSLHENVNDNGYRVVTFAISKNLSTKCTRTMF